MNRLGLFILCALLSYVVAFGLGRFISDDYQWVLLIPVLVLLVLGCVILLRADSRRSW